MITEGYSRSIRPTTLDRSIEDTGDAGWELYPVWAPTPEGTCTCPKGAACPSPGKHPMTRHGILDASSDPQEIAEMFSRAPTGANVGLATGRESGVVVLDWDMVGCGGGHRLLQRHGQLTPTRMHRSGSGNVHELYAYPPHLEHLPSRTIAPGCELKADGAGVLLPPSVTNWGAYEVVIEAPIAPLPGWIADLALHRLNVIEGEGQKSTESRFGLPDRIRERERWDTLWRYGCSLRAAGWNYWQIYAELRRVARDVCDQPPIASHWLTDGEVCKAARYATTFEPGSSSPFVSSEVLAALDEIEAALLARPWPGVGGKSEWSVIVALLRAARVHGELIHSGVRVSLATRPLAEEAGMPQPSLMRVVKRLRRAGLIRKDDQYRKPTDAGAFVLLHPPGRAHRYHSPTSVSSLEESGGREEKQEASFSAPRLRRWYGQGKTNEQLLDRLEQAGGEMRLGKLAHALGVKRVRDLRRRNVARLEDAGVVEVKRDQEGEMVLLRPCWLEALDREREASGEKQAERLERKQHEWQREAYRQHLVNRGGSV